MLFRSAWASTETRKIIKGEERIVHFLDAKQTVRQTDWAHVYADGCAACTLRPICGGLFDRGAAYDPAELAPQFVDPDAIVRAIIEDPDDPAYPLRDLAAWKRAFAARLAAATDAAPADDAPIPVGRLTEGGARRYQAKRRHEARLAEARGVAQEPDADADGDAEPA